MDAPDPHAPMPDADADPKLISILNAIRESPDDEAHWLALTEWLYDNGRDDEAVAVRVPWPTLRENLACVSLAATLAGVARTAAVLAEAARAIEWGANDTVADSPDPAETN